MTRNCFNLLEKYTSFGLDKEIIGISNDKFK